VENNQLYPFERNRYYAGKMLTSSDFRAEQTYFNNKRRFINSMIYGSGIVCGCNVFSLDDLSILVESGAAIDDFGREILIQTSAVKKLSAIEGFGEIEGDEVLLCMRYQETPVHSVFAVNRERQEDSYEYNRISEGYELFLKDTMELSAGFELENDFFMVNRLYSGKDFCVEVTMPVTVCKGALAKVHVRLKKLSDDVEPIGWRGVLQMPAFTAGDGKHELKMEFTDVTILKGQEVAKDYWVESEESEDEETNLVFQDERGNHSFKIRLRDADPDELVTEEIGKTSLEMLNLEEKKDYIILAKLKLLRTDSAYIIDEVREHGVKKYISAPGWEAKRKQYGAFFRKKDQVLHFRPENTKDDSRVQKMPPGKKEGPTVATGIVEIPLGADAKKGDICYSGEIMHGLGRGNVYIELGYEQYESENVPGANIKSIIYGNAELFDAEIEGIANVETAIKALNDKGSFIVAAKLLKNMDCLVLAYRWVAMLFPSGEENWKEEEYGNKSIAAETPTVVLGTRESYYFNVKFSNMEKCSVTYELTEGGSGDITADGVYTAPRKEGVYEIRIYCTDMPVICAYAYAIVRAKRDKERDRSDI
jgi:hypothetical protein